MCIVLCGGVLLPCVMLVVLLCVSCVCCCVCGGVVVGCIVGVVSVVYMYCIRRQCVLYGTFG